MPARLLNQLLASSRCCGARAGVILIGALFDTKFITRRRRGGELGLEAVGIDLLTR
jgi:hypothetical protein